MATAKRTCFFPILCFILLLQHASSAGTLEISNDSTRKGGVSVDVKEPHGQGGVSVEPHGKGPIANIDSATFPNAHSEDQDDMVVNSEISENFEKGLGNFCTGFCGTGCPCKCSRDPCICCEISCCHN